MISREEVSGPLLKLVVEKQAHGASHASPGHGTWQVPRYPLRSANVGYSALTERGNRKAFPRVTRGRGGGAGCEEQEGGPVLRGVEPVGGTAGPCAFNLKHLAPLGWAVGGPPTPGGRAEAEGTRPGLQSQPCLSCARGLGQAAGPGPPSLTGKVTPTRRFAEVRGRGSEDRSELRAAPSP